MSELIPPEDLSVEIVKHNAGGQHVGGMPLPMKVIHRPTGLEVIIPASHRSQHRQRSLAIEMIECALTSKWSL